MTGPTNPLPDDALRVGHAEREQVVELLGQSMAGGYLDLTEFEQRVASAHAASTRGELRALLIDLPASSALRLPGSPLPAAPSAPMAPTAAPQATGWTQPAEELELRGSMESTLSRRGVWRVPPRLLLTGSMATFKLDFSEAELPMGGIEIQVQATWSTIRLWLSRSMHLSTDQYDPGTWGSLKDKSAAPTEAGGVLVSLRGKPSMSTVVIRRSKK